MLDRKILTPFRKMQLHLVRKESREKFLKIILKFVGISIICVQLRYSNINMFIGLNIFIRRNRHTYIHTVL